MSHIIVENLGKAYSDKALFKNVNFTVEPGQKIALIAPNGAGKTTLFRILLGEEELYDGKIEYDPNISIGYLSQDINLEGCNNIWEFIYKAKSEKMKVFLEYENKQEAGEAIPEKLKDRMNELDLWKYKDTIKGMLQTFELEDENLEYYSGGQKKRLALLRVLLDEPDLLFLDEPTNHLDHRMLEYLENYLSAKSQSVFLISHDRYFLDRIVDTVFEIDKQQLFIYKGNYTNFVKKKNERIISENKAIERARSLLKKEQEWMNQSAEARRTKSKHRIENFYELQNQAKKKIEQELVFSVIPQRIGNKILEVENISKSFGDKILVKDFEFSFQQEHKIGIVGDNGVGKTTFLNLMMKEIEPDKGKVIHGKTISFGYFRQHIEHFDENKKVIDIVREYGEEYLTQQKKTLSLAKLLEKFLFPPRIQHQRFRTLSGGQKKRLTLLTILVQNPNFLILDEPTNDLDVMTLEALEEFLLLFQGCILVVSHDRYFMDKVIDELFVFEGNGKITPFLGTYSDYHSQFLQQTTPQSIEKKGTIIKHDKKKRDKIFRQIEKLEEKKLQLTNEFSQPLSGTQIEALTKDLHKITQEIQEKEEQWLSLG